MLAKEEIALNGLDALNVMESKLRFDRSPVHGWGVFSQVSIKASAMIIEYKGEIIQQAVAEERQAVYQEKNIDDYMFSMNDGRICDATKKGNLARYINSSCDPNCVSRTVQYMGKPRIVICAKRDIEVGEELFYDYKFPLAEREEDKIKCFCGAANCAGWMNWSRNWSVGIEREKEAELETETEAGAKAEADATSFGVKDSWTLEGGTEDFFALGEGHEPLFTF